MLKLSYQSERMIYMARISLDNGNTFLTVSEVTQEIRDRHLWGVVVEMADSKVLL